VRESHQASSRSPIGDYAVVVGVGLLVGLLVAILPLVSIALIVATLALAVFSLVRDDSRRGVLASGVLVGSGALYLYGAINTALACADGRCGGSTPWPLIAFVVVVLGSGLATGSILLARHR
jgi:hypothetical protein